MEIVKKLYNSVKVKWIIKRNLKKNGFDRKQFENDLIEWQNRNLNMEEILSRAFSVNVIVDAYEYCMRKCDWEPAEISDGSVKDFLLFVVFQGEADNGGIAQFLLNRSGDMTIETIEAMKHIDGDYAEILMAASQFFPDGIVPKEQKERMKIIDSFDEETINQIYELDRCMSDHDSTQKLYDFIHNHRGDFLNF